jgi:hypothetical protein
MKKRKINNGSNLKIKCRQYSETGYSVKTTKKIMARTMIK